MIRIFLRPMYWNQDLSPSYVLESGSFSVQCIGIRIFLRPMYWNQDLSPSNVLGSGSFSVQCIGIRIFLRPMYWNQDLSPSNVLESGSFSVLCIGIRIFLRPVYWDQDLSPSNVFESGSFSVQCIVIRVFLRPMYWIFTFFPLAAACACCIVLVVHLAISFPSNRAAMLFMHRCLTPPYISCLTLHRSHWLMRAFYIPFLSHKYRSYADYNILKATRTKRSVKLNVA